MLEYSDIHFTKDNRGFKHNMPQNKDYACFAIWDSGRSFLDEIEEILKQNFQIILKTEIEWSDRHFAENAARLYEYPITTHERFHKYIERTSNKIGGLKFILFIVSDEEPNYTYAKSVSGKIEFSNLNVVKVKYALRDLILEATGQKYGVHSTNSILEFYYQVPLLLGVENFKKILNGIPLEIKRLKKDLEGAGGWKDYHSLFEVLNLTTNYLVQRGFETLPEENEEMDIDFLTDNLQRFASAIGAQQKYYQPYKGHIKVGKDKITLDMRFVLDKYYDISWQKDMLNNKVKRNGVYVPREDDYFFSLLFHCKVQKHEVKEKYYGILEGIAKDLKFDWYNTELLGNNEKIGVLLKGYFKSQGYLYEDPIDVRVKKNREVIAKLPTYKNIFPRKPTSKKKGYRNKAKAFISKILPSRVFNQLLAIKKRLRS